MASPPSEPSRSMVEPATPPDEPERLAALRALHVLDTPPEERFDRITRIAKNVFGVPIALVSLVDADRQWFKSCVGLPVRQTPRRVSFCGHAILGEDTLVVPDATRDPRFAGNPLVTGEPAIRFYAGEPLEVSGHRVGTLCLVDVRPRELGTQERAILEDLARLAESELEATALNETQRELLAELDAVRRRAKLDPLTMLWNRGAIEDVLTLELARGEREGRPVSAIMADIDHFKAVNDAYGHPIGDVVIREVAARLRAATRPYDAAGRWGGEEFLIVVPGVDPVAARPVAERMWDRIRRVPVRTVIGDLTITASFGVAGSAEGRSGADVVEAADRALYAAKRRGRDQVVLEADAPPSMEPPSQT